MENVYSYIAQSNAKKAIELLDAYGYNHANTPDLGLSQLVKNHGEEALKEVIKIHPDKDIILDYFGGSNAPTTFTHQNGTDNTICNCASCRLAMQKHNSYLNATGDVALTKENNNNNNKEQNTLAMQTNIIIGVTALFFATALFLKNN